MTIAATVAVVTMSLASGVEWARWRRASRTLGNLVSCTQLLAVKDEDDRPADPFPVVIDLRNGQQWATAAKRCQMQTELGATRR